MMKNELEEKGLRRVTGQSIKKSEKKHEKKCKQNGE